MEIKVIQAEKALCATNIDLADYVINPYRGCELGCLYCYAQSNKKLQKMKERWGEFVDVKENLPQLLEKEIALLGDSISEKRVLIGSTTEPFPPIEKKYHITEKILQILKRHSIPFVILTKSPLILDYLPDIAYSRRNKVYLTYNSEVVRTLFEKNTSSQEARLKAISRLSKSEVDLIVYISPVFPGLTNMPEIFKNLRYNASKIYIEGYHPQVGNFAEVEKKLPPCLCAEYTRIFQTKESYDLYWEKFMSDTLELNEQYKYDLRYFVYSF